jgi:O-antigen ligase
LLASLPLWRWRLPRPKWLLAAPLFWFFWELLSATQTVRPDLTNPTILHFAGCLVSFYAGYFALSQARSRTPFWLGLLAGLLVVFWVGFNQHYGGLEQTRRAFEEMKTNAVQSAELQKLDTPEFRRKLESNRIFSTFVYPNTLAGAMLLFLPPTLFALWQMSRRASSFMGKLLVGLWAYGGLACLYWSGSKAGWLICLGMVLCAFLHLPIGKKIRWGTAIGLLALGMAGFAAKYSGYFSKGATSAAARTDYWRAAWQLSWEKPLLGSGPGTFQEGYKRLKSPESEMARLAHNDYLQQAADSGWPGFVLYSSFIWGSVVFLYRIWRRRAKSEQPNWPAFALWLGVAAFATQSLVEFGLYIPALAWPFFLFLGYLWRQIGAQNQIDKHSLPA